MLFDLRHHAILKQFLTESFESSLRENLVPRLLLRYGASLSGIQMYEDYLADGFVRDQKAYYPLTVVTGKTYETVWISWDFDGHGADFAGNIPYAYVGDGLLDFDLPTDVPAAFLRALEGRNRYYDGTYLPIAVETSEASVLTLAGRYSQTFLDEMGKQVTALLEKNAAVSSMIGSGIGLKLIFAPGTYMEHTSGNRTYRRLMMTDSVRTVRDLWVMWERKEGGAYSVADTPKAGDITFFLDMPVPLSVREREYRFLVRTCPEEYEKAMATRNLTAFHTVIRRAVARGDLFDLPKEAPAVPVSPIPETTVCSVPPFAEPVPVNEETEKPLAVPPAETVPEPVSAPAEEEPQEKEPEKADPLLLALARAAGVPLPEKEEEKEPQDDPWLDALRAYGLGEPSPETQKRPEEENAACAAENYLIEKMLRENAESTSDPEPGIPEPIVVPEPEPNIPEPIVVPEPEPGIPEPTAVPEPEPVPDVKPEIPTPVVEKPTSVAEKPTPKPESKKDKHPLTANYVLHLYFRFSTDPNASEYIRDILSKTLKSEGKEDLDISVKAVAVSYNELALTFYRFPQCEKDLLMKMICAIGHSDIGVSKIILDD